ncbi:MAG: ImmA/IrrE family metallo-endopeptidase [Oscillospiraceae bacterium]
MQWMMMTNSEIQSVADATLAKYLKKGNGHKILSDIMQAENIKFREISSTNHKFVGALTKASSGQFYIMVNDAIDNVGRKNFTIAHELGHYFLGHHLTTNAFYCCEDEIAEEVLTANSIEAEANYFASCFLMPEAKIKSAFLAMLSHSRKAKIKDFLHVKNDYTFSIWCGIRGVLMKRYGVSEAALRYRLKQLGVAKFSFTK